MSARACFILAVACLSTIAARADEALYRYEGDVLPYDESAGWLVADACEHFCTAAMGDGHFLLKWTKWAELVNFHYWIAQPPAQPPRTLWVEWRFRSDHPIPAHSYSCDAWFTVNYADVHEPVNLFGDAAVSFSGDDAVYGLDINQFHTYRFESLDGATYWISVDGLVFTGGRDDEGDQFHYLQFGGHGGCTPEDLPTLNEWDFIRFGTISYGEQIIASDPQPGFVSARQHAGLDRFAVTFNEPNYVYLDEITVEVTGGGTPVVTQTRRRENDEPDTVEIVLDRPIAYGQTTRLTFDDGVAVNVVEYTFAPGDTDGDGDADLHDFALFQTCIGQSPPIGPCAALDLRRNGTINLADYAVFYDLFAGG